MESDHIFAHTLETWYAKNGRELPWRQTTDPYKIWISEIILQQTRVAQGWEYYLRFIQQFPDVFALAQAQEDQVLKLWQGLGYYSRARNLHAAAKSIALQGQFPIDYAGVRALKGVGDYTAAAICSLAYGLPHAVLDGNVYRVLSRYLNIDTPIDSTAGKKLFTQLADTYLDKQNPAIYNQAIMDFGAMVCTPSNPQCTTGCPLADSCAALAEGTVDTLPVKEQKIKLKDRYFHYILVETSDAILLHKRTKNDIWKNLYELPLIEENERLLDEQEIIRHPFWEELLKCLKGPVTLQTGQRDLQHILSHRRIHTRYFKLSAQTCTSYTPSSGCFWVKKTEISQYAVSRLVSLIFEQFL